MMRQRDCSHELQQLPHKVYARSDQEVQQPRSNLVLDTIPVDVLVYICDHLPLREKATVAITTKKLYGSLGNRHLTLLNSNNKRKEKQSFLMLLKRDLRHLHLCWRCEQFHPMTACPVVGLDNSAARGLQCVQEDGILELGTSRGIHFRHAHALMTRVRHRWPHKTQLDSLTFRYEEPESLDNYRDRFIRARITTNVEPVIHQEELMLHVAATLTMADSHEFRKFQAELLPMCPHFHPTFFGFFGHEDPMQIISKQIGDVWNEKSDLPEFSKRISCTWCKTWFFVSARVYKESMLQRQKSIQVQLDIWRNLGPCIRPEDPTWSSHCLQLETPRNRLK